jgi:hypothetical protein
MVFSPLPEDSIGLVLEHPSVVCHRWEDYLIAVAEGNEAAILCAARDDAVLFWYAMY